MKTKYDIDQKVFFWKQSTLFRKPDLLLGKIYKIRVEKTYIIYYVYIRDINNNNELKSFELLEDDLFISYNDAVLYLHEKCDKLKDTYKLKKED